MQIYVPKVSSVFAHKGRNVRFVRGRTTIEEGHSILKGREHQVEPLKVDFPVSEPEAKQPPTPAPAPAPTPPPAEPDNALLAEIDAVATHATANDLAKRLGVDGFNDKTPSVAEKKAALLAKTKGHA